MSIKRKMEDNNTLNWSTDSLNLAAYLMGEGCRLYSINRTADPKKVLFVFEESKQRTSLTQKFLAYEARCEPHRLFSAMKDLKQLLYQKQSEVRND